MTAPLTLYLIRHGEVHNPEKILYGRMPGYGLSATGRQQATAAGRALAEVPLDAFYASPMQRAQETAGIIADVHPQEITIQTEERLNEVHTPYDGTPFSELEPNMLDIYFGNEAPHEQPRDVRRRLLTFLADMREQYAGGTVACVTHGDIVVAAFMYAKGQDENDIGRSRHEPGNWGRLSALGLPERYPATASLSRLDYITSNPDEIPAYTYYRPY
ncbi:MAG: histidine phosphatase family protein [Anaerolineae bacterium]|nr:histidine phosphatase family protein [Anaerolineae bacterium]